MARDSAADSRGGYLTVFLALSLTIILSLVLTLIEGARLNSLRMQTELVTDVAMNSVLAEFHRELQRQYDLFFIDTSYGSGVASRENVEAHLLEYYDKNFEMDGLSFFADRRDLTRLKVTSLSIENTRMICDENAQALREQVLAYMSAEPVGEAAGEVLQLISSYDGAGPDLTMWSRIRDETAQALADHELEDPGAAVESFRILPVLHQVFGDTSGLSGNTIAAGGTLSHRDPMRGNMGSPENSHHYGRADTVLFDEYLFEKCSRYGHELDKSQLKYQLEYILFGESSDAGNLEKMAQHLLAVRLALNTACLFADEAKKEEARTLAAVLSTILLSPELTEILAAAILLAWAYVESIYDLKVLFHNGRVPLVKDSSTWKTSIQNILIPAQVQGGGSRQSSGQGSGQESGQGSGQGSGGLSQGLSYENYLRIFLFLENGNMKNLRFMDMMEADIRRTPGNEAFQIDGCMDAFSMHVTVGSGYGYSCEMHREITYN